MSCFIVVLIIVNKRPSENIVLSASFYSGFGLNAFVIIYSAASGLSVTV